MDFHPLSFVIGLVVGIVARVVWAIVVDPEDWT
jgi:hypothetical protein